MVWCHLSRARTKRKACLACFLVSVLPNSISKFMQHKAQACILPTSQLANGELHLFNFYTREQCSPLARLTRFETSSRKKAEAVSLLLQVNQGGKQQKATFANSCNACSDSIAVSMGDFTSSAQQGCKGWGWGGEIKALRSKFICEISQKLTMNILW